MEENNPLGMPFLMDNDDPLGLNQTPSLQDGIEGAVNYLGGVARFYQEKVPKFLIGVRQGIAAEAAAVPEPTEGIDNVTNLPQDWMRAEARILDGLATGVENMGFPEPVAGAAALAVSPFIPGPAEMGLITKGGSALLGLTMTDPRFTKGIESGISNLPQNRAALVQLEENLGSIATRRASLTEKYADDPAKLQRKLTKLKKEEDGVISTLDNITGESLAYGKRSATNVDPTEPTRRNLKGELVSNPAHQHHLAGKAQTAEFVRAMRRVGDDDDLVAMHSHVRRVLNSMGNVDANMLDIPGKAHIAMKGATDKQRATNVHSLFDMIGVEPNAKAVRNYIGDVQNADQLMDRFNSYIAEYMKPQKELAVKITKKYLSDYRESLSDQDLIAYDDLVKKLSGL